MVDPAKRTYLNGRAVKNVRFTQETMKRIEEARAIKGQTAQTFIQIAVSRALDEVLNEKQSKQDHEEKKPKREPRGLGIREQLEQQSVAVEFEPLEERPAQPPVTVNVNPAPAGAASGDLATLARMVVEGPRHDRRRLLESACKALAKSSRNTEEALSLAEQLDAEIKRIDVPQTALERVRARRKK